MKTPFICRVRAAHRNRERGVTMVLVAVALVSIIAMAALSIDVITLYLAKQEAQRSTDAAALAAAKIIAVSGVTGDPNNTTSNWAAICGGTSGIATRVATAVANQNLVGSPVITPTVTYSSGGTSNTDCSFLNLTGFGVNPIVTVQLTRTNLPTFFSRIWGNRGNNVSATATAEVFNPSDSGNSGNQVTGTLIPVQPRCVKPWVVANQDPFNPISSPLCNQGGGPCQKIVNLPDGSIHNPGISLNGGGATPGIIGETFWLTSDCHFTNKSTCSLRIPTPKANVGGPHILGPPNLMYLPGSVGTPVTAVPSCTDRDPFGEAIEGCDAPTNYACGVPPLSGGTNSVDLSRNPDDPTRDGVSCLIHETTGWNTTGPSGQDYLNPFMAPSSYPFQILAGSSSAMVSAGLATGSPISMSPSIVSLPIYDETDPNVTLVSGTTVNVTFVGFLQVFINAVDQDGNVSVTVLNVTGCSNGANPVGSPVLANSPVPVRLITPP